MNIELLKTGGTDIAIISGNETVITDPQSALDMAMTVRHETGASSIIIAKDLICRDFFTLSTGIAGEILQKFINYHVKLAVYGDYSHNSSKPLQDFIYESNHGKNFFFVTSKEEAIQKLILAQ